MRSPAIPFLAACAALAFLIVPAPAQETDASVELLSGNSDCATRSQVTNDGFVRQLIRCINDGITRFAVGCVPIDENGLPDQLQEPPGDVFQDLIELYADLGWGVAAGVVDDFNAPVEYNASAPFYIFYRNPDDCQPGNCLVPGDAPGTEAFLTEAWDAGLGGWERLVPLQPDWDCYYDDTQTFEPCWSYIDCNGVKHYAECVADVAQTGFAPFHPPCATCEVTVGLENESWGRIKSLYRVGEER